MTNFRYNYNIRFLDVQKPDNNIYFKPGDFWSLNQPVPLPPSVPDQGQNDKELPPIEDERQYFYPYHSMLVRQISPILEQAGSSRIRSDRVCVLPQDDLMDHLSPQTRRRAGTLHLHPGQEYMRSGIARSLTPLPNPVKPQARILQSLEKMLLGKK